MVDFVLNWWGLLSAVAIYVGHLVVTGRPMPSWVDAFDRDDRR